MYILKEIVLNHAILAPIMSEVVLGAAADLASLCWEWRVSGGSAAEPREATFYAQASQTLIILTEGEVHT